MITRSTPPPDVPMRPSDLPLPDETLLPNGLRLLTLPDRRAPVVEFRLILPYAGRAYDAPDWIGLSGAVARLLIGGTPSRSSFEIADEADRCGGYISVSANTETAILSARCLAPYLEPMTRLIADVLLHPVFPPDEVEIDRANTLQRLRLQRSQPAFLAEERFRLALFGEHPYCRLAPDEDALQRWSQEQLQAFHAAHYRPQGATLLIVGDFEPEGVRQILQDALGGWEGAVAQAPVPAPPMENAERGWLLVERPNSVQSQIMLGTLCPPRTAPDSLALQLAVSVLGAGASSRLFLTVREQYGYAYSVSAHLDYYLRIGAFTAEAQTATENTHDAIRQICAEVERLIQEPIPAEELDATRNYLIGRHMISRLTLGSLTDLYKQTILYGLPLDYWRRYPEMLASLTAGEAQQAAAQYLNPEQFTTVVVGDPTLGTA
ncbi:MAG: insulinase family protein [Fimbriimonadales bacterium]|nr:insulinase family protein [Fimbriimonadales bacterium]